MTHDEFKDWFKHHTAANTGIHAWLSKIPVDPPRGIASRRETMDAWERARSRVSLEAAKAATDMMFAGHVREPKGYDKHPAAVAKLAREMMRDGQPAAAPRRRYVDGEQTFQCLSCEDEGMVFVWHSQSMRYAAGLDKKQFPSATGTCYSMVVACACHLGDQWAKRLRGRYTEQKYLRIERRGGVAAALADPQQQQQLLEFVAARAGPDSEVSQEDQGQLF